MVKIITDSGALFENEAEIRDLGVSIVPLRIAINGQIYHEGQDIDTPTLLDKMTADGLMPMSLPPTREFMEKVYREAIKESEEILGIYTSGHLNPVASVAREASIPFLGRARITVVDSETVSLGLGIMVKEAAKAALQGRSLDEIVRLVRGMIPYIYVVSFVQHLGYLRRSRIISPSQALLGTMLGIKVFLTIENGRFIPLEKVQTEEEMADKLFEFAAEFTTIERMAVLKNGFDGATRLFLNKLDSLSLKIEVPILPYNPSMLCFLGPQAMTLVVYEGGS